MFICLSVSLCCVSFVERHNLLFADQRKPHSEAPRHRDTQSSEHSTLPCRESPHSECWEVCAHEAQSQAMGSVLNHWASLLSSTLSTQTRICVKSGRVGVDLESSSSPVCVEFAWIYRRTIVARPFLAASWTTPPPDVGPACPTTGSTLNRFACPDVRPRVARLWTEHRKSKTPRSKVIRNFVDERAAK